MKKDNQEPNDLDLDVINYCKKELNKDNEAVIYGRIVGNVITVSELNGRQSMMVDMLRTMGDTDKDVLNILFVTAASLCTKAERTERLRQMIDLLECNI